MNRKQAVPFPDIPLPTKFKRIKIDPEHEPKVESVSTNNHTLGSEPIDKQLPDNPPKPDPKPDPSQESSIPPTDFPELIVGGELEPEPPKIIDKGDHIVEEVDYSDYL